MRYIQLTTVILQGKFLRDQIFVHETKGKSFYSKNFWLYSNILYIYMYIYPVCAERSLKNTPTKSSKKQSAGSNAGIININYLLYIVVHVPIILCENICTLYLQCVQCIQLCILNSSKSVRNCGELISTQSEIWRGIKFDGLVVQLVAAKFKLKSANISYLHIYVWRSLTKLPNFNSPILL